MYINTYPLAATSENIIYSRVAIRAVIIIQVHKYCQDTFKRVNKTCIYSYHPNILPPHAARCFHFKINLLERRWTRSAGCIQVVEFRHRWWNPALPLDPLQSGRWRIGRWTTGWVRSRVAFARRYRSQADGWFAWAQMHASPVWERI